VTCRALQVGLGVVVAAARRVRADQGVEAAAGAGCLQCAVARRLRAGMGVQAAVGAGWRHAVAEVGVEGRCTRSTRTIWYTCTRTTCLGTLCTNSVLYVYSYVPSYSTIILRVHVYLCCDNTSRTRKPRSISRVIIIDF
jgi:hypothetical protein